MIESAGPAPRPASPQDSRPLAAMRANSGLWLLLAGVVLWSGWFIFRSSFEAGGKRVFCLFDDAMISMTYARNVLEGHGLNWARMGEPVEGFSHPLWTALMVGVNALPVELRFRSLPVQLLGVLVALLNVLVVRRLMLRHFVTETSRLWMPAAILTAFYQPLSYWSLMGMESGLQALLTTASVLLALDVVYRGEDRHLALLAIGAAAYLLRMDMLLMALTVQAFVIGQGGLRKEQRKSWWWGLGCFAAAVLGYSLFRWLYFHDVLPNTYYLKLDGIPLAVRLLRGVKTFSWFASDHLLLLAAVAVGTATLGWGDGRRDRRLLLPAAVFVVACAYDVYVGGDVWEKDTNMRANRFVVYAMPLVFVLFNALINRIVTLQASRRAAATPPGPAGRDLTREFLVAMATTIAFLVANGLWLSAEDPENWVALAVLEPPYNAENNGAIYGEVSKLQGLLAPGAVVATSWAGVPAFFTDFRMVDLLGYNERHIAHSRTVTPLTIDRFEDFMPGHAKWDFPYVLARYRPDAFLNFRAVPRFNLADTLKAAGYVRLGSIWLRPGSPYAMRPRPPG
jgi:arabinofuranosyltransferase